MSYCAGFIKTAEINVGCLVKPVSVHGYDLFVVQPQARQSLSHFKELRHCYRESSHHNIKHDVNYVSKTVVVSNHELQNIGTGCQDKYPENHQKLHRTLDEVVRNKRRK